MTDTVIRRPSHCSYPDRVNPRVRRLIVSGVLVGLLVLVVVAAVWQRAVG
jgi:hypothetical protein